MDKQEAFDKMIRGLSAQGWQQSLGPKGGPVYSSPEGLCCAIGHLITQKEASEGDALLRTVGDLFPYLDADECNFLIDCQDAHDMADNSAEVYVAFCHLLIDHALVWPEDVPKDAPLV